MSAFGSVVCLSGGVGGARLLHGLDRALPEGVLTAIVNTGDDFRHWGLFVSPDLDTVMYTLSELADEQRGWGLKDESFRALERMKSLGEPAWFSLGDKDLATHIARTEALTRGATLTRVTERLCKAAGVRARVLPMCDAPRATLLDTFEHGVLPFQEWLVKERAPSVRGVRFVGENEPSAAVLAALHAAELIVIGPSNPYVSIDPMLTLKGVRAAMHGKRVVALSPIVAGRAVKGPLADMLRTLGQTEPSARAIATHYEGLLTGMVVERGDEAGLELPVLPTSTVMGGAADRERLARELLAFAAGLP